VTPHLAHPALDVQGISGMVQRSSDQEQQWQDTALLLCDFLRSPKEEGRGALWKVEPGKEWSLTATLPFL